MHNIDFSVIGKRKEEKLHKKDEANPRKMNEKRERECMEYPGPLTNYYQKVIFSVSFTIKFI